VSQAAIRAVERIRAGENVLISPGCGYPSALVRALLQQSDRLSGTKLWSGLLLGTYPFLDEPHSAYLEYRTWHVTKPIRDRVASGHISYFPLRASSVMNFIRRTSLADTLMIQVSPPGLDGRVSLGTSPSYPHPARLGARRIIGAINPSVPRVNGCTMKFEELTDAIDVEDALPQYRTVQPDTVSRRIAEHLEPFVRDGATLQIGVGHIPEALLGVLLESGRRQLSIWGVGFDGLVDLAEAGMLLQGEGPAVHATEWLGTTRLFEWMDNNATCMLIDLEECTDPRRIGGLRKFTSINSAIEVDLWGSVNAEAIDGVQVTGLGAIVDFVEGARRAPDGLSVIALPATAREGQVSRIVMRLARAPETISRATVQVVATEYGAVDLSILDLDARANAMIGLAAPQFRDGLSNEYETWRSLER
jgi:4-hydroxybutyrate CoA-transferase